MVVVNLSSRVSVEATRARTVAGVVLLGVGDEDVGCHCSDGLGEARKCGEVLDGENLAVLLAEKASLC